MTTMWKKYKDYINKRNIGDVILRKEVLPHLYGGHQNIPKSTYGTGGDNYRRMLEMLGIITTVARGQYKILYHIKENVTATQAHEMAYCNNWKQWFINIKVEDKLCERKL